MTCPECGSKTKIVNGVVKYHTRPDNLAACPMSRIKAEDSQPAKAAPKKTTKKAAPKKQKSVPSSE